MVCPKPSDHADTISAFQPASSALPAMWTTLNGIVRVDLRAAGCGDPAIAEQEDREAAMRPSARHRRSIGFLLAMLVVVTTVGQARASEVPADEQAEGAGTAERVAVRSQVADPDDADIPDYICEERFLGVFYYQPVAFNSSDYIIWQCVYTPVFKYWWKMRRIGNQQEDEERGDYKWLKFGASGVWQGIVQSGFAVIDVDGDPRNDNLDSVASFDLRGPSGSPIYRTLATRLLVAVSKNGGPWNACSDTGWEQAPPNTFFWETILQYGNGPKCGTGRYSAWAAGRFKSVSTGQWVTTDWVKTDPIAVIVPAPS